MRFGGPLFQPFDSPETWVTQVQQKGYRAAMCPIPATSDAATIRTYADAAARADIVIAETGAWSNPLSADATERSAALENCKANLALADAIGARCCVNIAGSRGAQWDGPHPDNLSDETFEMIVETTREIIDTVKPTRSFYTLETMPWIFPHSPDSYLALVHAIDRPGFAVHLDPVNLINSPERYYRTGDFIRECFEKLGPYIKSCHAKDIYLQPNLTVHLDEVRPGQGGLDYTVFLTELNKLDPDTTLFLEHLPSETEYDLAATYIKGLASELNLSI
jgi:sugar phosphate isomerase/epimerase